MTTQTIEVRVSVPGFEELGVLTVYLRQPLELEDVQLVWRAGMAPWLALEARIFCGQESWPCPVLVIGGASGPVTRVHTPRVIIPPVDPVSTHPSDRLLLATIPAKRVPPVRAETSWERKIRLDGDTARTRSAEELHAITVAGKYKHWPEK